MDHELTSNAVKTSRMLTANVQAGLPSTPSGLQIVAI